MFANLATFLPRTFYAGSGILGDSLPVFPVVAKSIVTVTNFHFSFLSLFFLFPVSFMEYNGHKQNSEGFTAWD
jgi:hypothetical protein